MSEITGNNIKAVINRGSRFALINAPAIDIRLPWKSWQQPVGLIKIGTYIRSQGCDVRLIDCLQVPVNGRLSRKMFGQIEVEGYPIDIWRFGLPSSKVISKLREWQKEGWKPDIVLISCGMSIWWQGTRELISQMKSVFKIPIVLGGSYPTFYPEHAASIAGVDTLIVGDVSEAGLVIPDLSIYNPEPSPRFAGIYLLHPAGVLTSAISPRNPQEVALEVREKACQGVTTFALFDSFLGPEFHQPLVAILTAIFAQNISNIHFIAPGNISPRLIDNELAILLKQVGFKHIYLHDDILHTPNQIDYLSKLDDYKICMNAMHQAGFRSRTDEVGAALVIGLPGENLDDLTDRLIRLSSIVGSIHIVPFQFTPGTAEGKPYEHWLSHRNGSLDPSLSNGRTFPLARLAGASYEDYLEITRLVALLNSKFHSRTFDFMGSGLTARLVRKSLQDQLWNPFAQRVMTEEEQERFIPLPIKGDK